MSQPLAPDTVAIALADLPATDAFGLSLRLDGAECIETIAAPGPGRFRARRSKSDVPARAEGALLPAGTAVGFLQRGPLLLPVVMPCDGWLLASAPDGARVGYGAPLLCILSATGAIIP